jgi:hypothetical protein
MKTLAQDRPVQPDSMQIEFIAENPIAAVGTVGFFSFCVAGNYVARGWAKKKGE